MATGIFLICHKGFQHRERHGFIGRRRLIDLDGLPSSAMGLLEQATHEIDRVLPEPEKFALPEAACDRTRHGSP
jgi:hypothetical protein